MYFLHVNRKNEMRITGCNKRFQVIYFDLVSDFFFLKVKSKRQVMPR
jgi:hypothetical protein